MTGGSRGGAYRVRPRVSHAGGAGGSGGSVGPTDKSADIERLLAAAGGVRYTATELRAIAELARANAPSISRYVIWALAEVSGQPISEIERIRVKDAPYFMEFLKTRKVPDGIG